MLNSLCNAWIGAADANTKFDANDNNIRIAKHVKGMLELTHERRRRR